MVLDEILLVKIVIAFSVDILTIRLLIEDALIVLKFPRGASMRSSNTIVLAIILLLICTLVDSIFTSIVSAQIVLAIIELTFNELRLSVFEK